MTTPQCADDERRYADDVGSDVSDKNKLESKNQHPI